MTEIDQAKLFMSDSDAGSSSEIASSEADTDSTGSLRDFVVGEGSEFVPDSETASVASIRSGERLKISETLDYVILDLIRLRDLMHERVVVETAESDTST
ncbi:hypothetical protein V2A60_002420 [Cordyceps javanica]